MAGAVEQSAGISRPVFGVEIVAERGGGVAAVNACRLNVSHCAPEHGTCREHAGSLARRLFLVFQPIFERNPVIEF